jgi:Tfp pilus assembly protein PilE
MNDRRGSILIEVLLSVVILAVSLTVVLRSLFVSLRSVRFSSDYTQGLLLSENKMFEYFHEKPAEDFIKEGSYEEPFEHFSYRVEVKELDSQEKNSIRRIDLTTFWLSGKNVKEISLASYLFYDH